VLWFVFGPNTGSFSKDGYFYVHTGSNYEAVKKGLVDDGFIRDVNSFDLLAKQLGYPSRVHPGKYKITRGMSNFGVVRLLRSGKQTPVALVITKLRTKQDLINLIGSKLEADTNVLKHMLTDTVYLAQFGLDTNTAICAVMPDSYELYWNTSADKAFRKIAKQYTAFWTEKRKQKAQQLGLTPQECITIASIVTEESNKSDEWPKIASVYYNRVQKGMKLQADPTARFAWGDFTIKRITSQQTSLASAYNTYYITGLPPGPICTPNGKAIDAVLNMASTNYLYFCAKEDFSGYHNFAATYEDHQKNANRYHDALNARGIR
jgi:UPF0755 protein